MTQKAKVHYTEVQFTHEKVTGGLAFVIPVDHTNPYVTNGQIATTSTIVKWDEETGTFETLNTIYVPVAKE